MAGKPAEQQFRLVLRHSVFTISRIGVVQARALILARTIRLQLRWADPSRRRRLLRIINLNTFGIGPATSCPATKLTNQSGRSHTATVVRALCRTTGGSNIAWGFQAGVNVTTGSNNIDIGHAGIANESNKCGSADKVQNVTFIAGIRKDKGKRQKRYEQNTNNNISDGGGNFFGASDSAAFQNWPLHQQSHSYERSQLGFKAGVTYPNTVPGLSDQQNAGGLPDGDGASKAALRQFFLRQDKYERDGNSSGLRDAAPIDLLRHAK